MENIQEYGAVMEGYKNYGQLPWRAEAEKLVELFSQHSGWEEDVFGRTVIIQPIFAQYSNISAVIIQLNGSPPRGTLYLHGTRVSPEDFFFIRGARNRNKNLTDKQAEIVNRFMNVYFQDWRGHAHPKDESKAALDRAYVIGTPKSEEAKRRPGT